MNFWTRKWNVEMIKGWNKVTVSYLVKLEGRARVARVEIES